VTGRTDRDAPDRAVLDGEDWWMRPFLGDEWQHHRAHLPGPADRDRWWRATVPGSAVTDARRAGAIPDPYRGLNSRAAEWLADRTLVYRTEFDRAPLRPDDRATLVLEGIDYQATVFCDGVELGRHVGQFTPFRADVTRLMRDGGPHLLAVVVEPAPTSEPQVGHTSRVRTTKTRMSYGWDFCPRLVHQGIWRSVRLETTGPIRLGGMRVAAAPSGVQPHGPAGRWTVTVAIDEEEAGGGTGIAEGAVQGGDVACQVTLVDPDDTIVDRVRATPVPGRRGRWVAHLDITEPQVWWPNGFGPHPLYRAVSTAQVGDRTSDRRELTFGLRTLGFGCVAGASPDSLPYLPVVNGVPVPVHGWNWVPADLAYGSAPPGRVRHLVGLAARAGATVLRVWGGGLIESDEFYRACDEAGVLVWQEFTQSSSGVDSVPSEDPQFLRHLVTEAEHVVRARRHHPSLAIWCAGNELADADGHPLTTEHPVVAALRDVVGQADPDRLFLPTSPSGPSFTNEPAAADAAPQHDVHGPWEHQGLADQYARYNAATCQLLSEFGVEGMATTRVLDQVVGEAGLRMPTRGTELWDHLGRWWNNEALVQRSFGNAIADIDELSRCSQFLQADGLRYAIEAQRRRWPACAGTIVWQLNEPFPNAWCTSVVDHTGAPKPAYHAVAQAYRPLTACARLDRQAFDGAPGCTARLTALRHGRRDGGAGRTTSMVTGEATATDLYGNVLAHRTFGGTVSNASPADLGSLDVPFSPSRTRTVVLTLQLTEQDGERSRTRYLLTSGADFAELLRLPAATITASATAAGPDSWSVTIANTGPVAAPFVRLRDGRPFDAPGWLVADDSGFHLMPGERTRLTVQWPGAPAGSRRILLDAFNLAPMLLTEGAPTP
jgi:beta-mannosidase